MRSCEPKTLKMLAAALASAASVLPSVATAAEIGDSLKQAMANLGAGETAEVIVSFESDGAPTLDQVEILEDLGLKGVTLQALPIAGVVATPAQIEALDANPEVRSLWLNETLEYDNAFETALTGVDRLRADANLRSATGLPFSGKGVGVLVNDSGVDGQHPDLQNNVVQNVAAQFNLHSFDEILPITWVENIPDTDIAGGHGSHVSGIIAGTGAASGGAQEGVAPGVDLIGYGSGAGLFILDTLGAFDYALVNQFRYNIRVVANSFGSTGDTGTDFNPDDPTNIATKKLTDRGIVVVISAGNSGSGEGTITGNFKKAPWIITVAAGDNDGNLTDFSSRGRRDTGGTVVVDGETLAWEDRPTVTAPGNDVISVRAKSDPLAAAGTDPNDPLNIYYQTQSGTSMSSPHVSGTVALMLEANPQLSWREVKQILQDTATNMPGREAWEVGAGYLNAYAAVMAAAGLRDDFGATQTLNRNFVADVHETRVPGPNKTLTFSPVGANDVQTFNVASGLSTVVASANVGDNTVAIVLTDPDGNRYGSSISLPVLGQNIAVTAPATPGAWTVEVSGIGSVSGVALDPLGLTNGTALPTPVDVDIEFFRVDGFSGLNDVAGHPAQGFIEKGVAERLVDAQAGGFYNPDDSLTRRDLADYLTQGGGVRQFRASDGGAIFNDTFGDLEEAAAEAVTARGAAMRDRDQSQQGVMIADGAGSFDPEGTVNRAELAFTLVQAMGLESEAETARQALEHEPVTVAFGGERIALDDDALLPAGLRGYVQLALDLQLMRATFTTEQGPFDFEPTLHATFAPSDIITRSAYAFNAVNLFDRLNQASE